MVSWVLSSGGVLSRDTHCYRTRLGSNLSSNMSFKIVRWKSLKDVGSMLWAAHITWMRRPPPSWRGWRKASADATKCMVSLAKNLMTNVGLYVSMYMQYMLNVAYSKKCPTPAPSVMRCAQEGSAVTVAAWVSRSDLKRRSDGNTMLLLLGCASDPGCIRLKRGVHKYKMKYTAMIPSLSCQINQYGHGFLDDANTNKNRCSFLRILSLVSVCVCPLNQTVVAGKLRSEWKQLILDAHLNIQLHVDPQTFQSKGEDEIWWDMF